MIVKNDFNVLIFSNNFEEIYQKYYKVAYSDLWIFNKNDFPYFEIDLSKYKEYDIDNIQLTLVNIVNPSDTINFKSIIDFTDLIYENFRLIYRSKEFNALDVNLLGCYYLKIEIIGLTLYSNAITFKDLGFTQISEGVEIDFQKGAGANVLELVFGNDVQTGEVSVSWGDGIVSNVTINGLDISTSKDYGSDLTGITRVTVFGDLDIIKYLKISNERVIKIEKLESLTGLFDVDFSFCKITDYNLLTNSNLRYVNMSNTLINTILNINRNITHLTLQRCFNLILPKRYTYMVGDRTDFDIFSKLKEVDLFGCGILVNAFFERKPLIEKIKLRECQLPNLLPFKNRSGSGQALFGIDWYEYLNEFDISRCNLNGFNTEDLNDNIFYSCRNFDFSDNSLSRNVIDSILERIVNRLTELNDTTTPTTAKLEGFNFYNTDRENEKPRHRVMRVITNAIGSGYSVGNRFRALATQSTYFDKVASTFTVTGVNQGGGIIEFDLWNRGAGFDIFIADFQEMPEYATGGSGASFSGYSAKYLLDTVYTNVTYTHN